MPLCFTPEKKAPSTNQIGGRNYSGSYGEQKTSLAPAGNLTTAPL